MNTSKAKYRKIGKALRLQNTQKMRSYPPPPPPQKKKNENIREMQKSSETKVNENANLGVS
jgi:hypothetical protein